MEVSMSITRRGKYTNSNICINVQVRNVVCLFFLLYANLLVLVTLCEGNHYPFIEERYKKIDIKHDDNVKMCMLFCLSFIDVLDN